MDKIDWTYIGTLFSVAFGWLLNEVGQWFRTRKEDKKIKKQILFHLLETHFTFNKLDTSKIIQLLTDRILARAPEHEQTETARQYINQLYSSFIWDFIEDNVADTLDEMEEHYTKVINDLSKIDPITAYRLNGKTKIIDTFDLLHDYFDEVKEKFPNEPEVDDKIDLMMDKIKPEMIRDAISDIEKEINDIALSINLWTWIRAKKTLKKSKEKIQKDDEKKIDELLNAVLPT